MINDIKYEIQTPDYYFISIILIILFKLLRLLLFFFIIILHIILFLKTKFQQLIYGNYPIIKDVIHEDIAYMLVI